jgi:hypothetical protein
MGRPRKPNTLGEQASLMYTLHHAHPTNLPPWRNRLARSAVNRKVGGSSPPGGDPFCRLGLFLHKK